MPTLPPDLVSAFLPAARASVERERALRRAAWATDRRAFRMDNRRVGKARLPYRDTFAPWQEEHFFLPLDAGKWLWNETPRGHDRTDGEGWVICDRLQHGPAFQRGIVAAADKEQARFPLERAQRYAADHPDLFPDIRVQKNEILGPRGSKCVVLSSDVASSLGELPDWVMLEEVGVWPERGSRLKDSILGSCMKRGAPVAVFTNAGAGKQGNWRWDFREWFRGMAGAHPDRFHFWNAPGWVAEWSRAEMELLRAALSPTEAARFLDNIWLEQNENPAFPVPDIEAAFEVAYRVEGDVVLVHGEADPRPIVAAVQASDYGLTDDAACVGALVLTRDGHRWLDSGDAFAGRPGEEVQIREVETVLLSNAGRRHLEATVFDPWQSKRTIQEHGSALRAEEYDFVSLSNRRALYAVLRQALKARVLHFPRGAFSRVHVGGSWDLRRELVEAVSQNRGPGEIMDHPVSGYLDAAVTVSMALVRLAQVSVSAGVFTGHDGPAPWARPNRRRW